MSDDRANLADDPVHQLLRPSRLVVPIAGAGVAQDAGLPSSGDLAGRLLELTESATKFSGDSRSLRQVVDFLVSGHVSEPELLELAATEISESEPAPSLLVDTLVRVPSRFLVTLNFDLALEHGAKAAGIEVQTLGNSREDLGRAVAILADEAPPGHLTVLHLHGSILEPDHMVLAPDGYKHVFADPLGQVLHELAVRRTMVFFGTTLDEPYLLTALSQIDAKAHHVLWCLESEESKLISERAAILPGNSGIYVRPVSHLDELSAKARLLLDADLPPAKPTFARVARGEDRLYVENRLTDRRHPNDPQDLVMVSLGLEPSGEVHEEPTEDEVLELPRSIVLGDPGTGKTELLLRLMERSGPSKSGLLIRLAEIDLDPDRGPLATLAAWACLGSTATADLDVSPQALSQQRFHFFLDGLDEVAAEHQAQVARQINRLAEEFPRHAFTVSTRPLPSLDLLRLDSPESTGWSQLTLAPDEGWRDRFLEAKGVSLAALYSDMPALEDLEEILATPFYLGRIVELHERSELRGIGDFNHLLVALLDSAIDREQGALGLDNQEIRAWLRRVALAAVIAGRRVFSAEDLGRFTLPKGKTDVIELARLLEQRLLLAEENGSYRFHHRLLGEQLAAEALVDAGPSHALLDCLVPYVDRPLSGVRPDLSVPVALGCLSSSDWRKAVAERDPLAAARATPDDAALKEREHALEALWEHAVEAQVWIWERGTQLTDDAEAMGRLLRGCAASPIAAVISEAARSGSDQDQGNAIRVLSRAGIDGLEELLDQVLSEAHRDEVVLRQAMMAAADAGFLGLVDRIVGLLLQREQSSVHQVGAIALRKLFGDQARIDLYMRLMGGPEADYMLVNAFEHVKPGDKLLLLSEYLGQGNEVRDFWSRDKVPAIFDEIDFDCASSAEKEAAVDVAVYFDQSHAISELRRADPGVILQRLAYLDSNRDLGWWELVDVVALFEPDELLEAGISEEIVDMVTMRRQAEAARTVAEAENKPWPPVDRAEETDGEEEDPPTLEELLDRDDSDVLILNNARYFASQVPQLDETKTTELHRRLDSWWPEKEFRKTITRNSANSWSQEANAYAWICFGPGAKPPLTAQRWAQLATSGVLFEEHELWLSDNETTDAVYQALELLEEEPNLEIWHQCLSCCSDPIPNPVLEASAVAVKDSAMQNDSTDLYRRREIVRKYISNGRLDLAHRLASCSDALAAEIAPILAAAGDLQAQITELDSLLRDLEQDKLPAEERLSWLNAAVSPSLLERLFAVLKRTWAIREESTGRPRIEFGFNVTSPTMEAIASIGGREAVAAYDALIDEGSEFRWLRRTREDVAGAVLIADGDRYAEKAASSVGVPWIGVDE